MGAPEYTGIHLILKFAKPFLYSSVSFSATAVLFDWIKFDVWNQVVLVVLQSSYSRASHGSSKTFETGLKFSSIAYNTIEL